MLNCQEPHPSLLRLYPNYIVAKQVDVMPRENKTSYAEAASAVKFQNRPCRGKENLVLGNGARNHNTPDAQLSFSLPGPRWLRHRFRTGMGNLRP